MEPAKVYFSDLRTDEVSTLEKLHRLMKAAGFEQIDFKDKYVAIKLHFGEPGNLAYLRPNWARVVCDYVRELGGKPFLTDCNTLYVGGRANALDHLDSAMRNGYTPMTTGAQCIIADGLKGDDYDLVPIRGGKYGALKNIGMGCGSRAGKEEMHSSGKPVVDTDKCIGCGKCVENCAHNGPHIENGKCTILKYKCTGCGRCINVCPMHAIHADYAIANELLNCKIAEYAKAVVDGRPSFHIALAVDVSPCCDCHNFSDVPIVPNVGMFASFDPVALDQACVDACLRATPYANSQLGDHLSDPHWHHHHDHFLDSNPNVRWKETLKHAEKLGVGSREYELITMK